MSEEALDWESATPQPLEHVVATDFEGGEGVLVDLNTKKYYQLNATAMLVWHALERRKTVREVVEDMTAAYEVTPEHARASVGKILDNFASLKLVGPR